MTKTIKQDKLNDRLSFIEGKLEALLAEVTDITQRYIPQKGESSYDCQHIAIMQAIGDLEACIAGLESDDLIPNEHYEIANKNAGYEPL